MKPTPHTIWIILLATSTVAGPASAGKIADTQSTTRGSSSSDDDDDDGGSILGAILHAIFNHDDDDNETASGTSGSGSPRAHTEREIAFHDHPYADRQPGIAIIHVKQYDAHHQLTRDRVTPANATAYSGKAYAGTWQGDYQYDWNNVHIATVRARFMSSHVIGLDLKWSGLFEPLDNGTTDTAHMGELGLTFSRAFSPNFIGRFGFGAHLMAFPGDDASVAFGGTGMLGFDFFPVRPLVFSAETQIGYLNEAIYLRADATIGFMVFGPLEANVGYRVQTFQNVESDNKVRFHGFTAGLRLWF